jgi:hypothetical protein
VKRGPEPQGTGERWRGGRGRGTWSVAGERARGSMPGAARARGGQAAGAGPRRDPEAVAAALLRGEELEVSAAPDERGARDDSRDLRGAGGGRLAEGAAPVAAPPVRAWQRGGVRFASVVAGSADAEEAAGSREEATTGAVAVGEPGQEGLAGSELYEGFPSLAATVGGVDHSATVSGSELRKTERRSVEADAGPAEAIPNTAGWKREALGGQETVEEVCWRPPGGPAGDAGAAGAAGAAGHRGGRAAPGARGSARGGRTSTIEMQGLLPELGATQKASRLGESDELQTKRGEEAGGEDAPASAQEARVTQTAWARPHRDVEADAEAVAAAEDALFPSLARALEEASRPRASRSGARRALVAPRHAKPRRLSTGRAESPLPKPLGPRAQGAGLGQRMTRRSSPFAPRGRPLRPRISGRRMAARPPTMARPHWRRARRAQGREWHSGAG